MLYMLYMLTFINSFEHDSLRSARLVGLVSVDEVVFLAGLFLGHGQLHHLMVLEQIFPDVPLAAGASLLHVLGGQEACGLCCGEQGA